MTLRQSSWFAALVIAIYACDPVVRPPEVSEVLQAFGVKTEASTVINTPPKVRLYFDRSESMRGFAAAEGSLYRKVIGALQDHAATTATQVEQFAFDDQPAPLNGEERTRVTTPGFYNRANTDFSHVLPAAAPVTGAASIIVSDLVQSVAGTDARTLASALRDLGQSRPEVLLLAFRSAFRGEYFVEAPHSRGDSFWIEFDGLTPHGSRPFYVLVLAASKEELNYCWRNLLGDVPVKEKFLASESAFDVLDLMPVPERDVLENRWNLFRKSHPVEELGRGRTISFLSLGPAEEQPPLLRLAMKIETRTPLRSLQDIDLELSARTYLKGKWERKELSGSEPRLFWAPTAEQSHARQPSAAVEKQAKKPGEIWLELPASRPPAGGWDAYRLRLAAGGGNLLSPIWVDTWNTDDDSRSSQAHRTLQLDLFVEALRRSIQERVILTDQLILVGRKE